MADFLKLKPKILKWEGGFSNHPNDPGGATMKGITLSTFRHFYGKDKTVSDLKAITEEQWNHIFKTGYWDKMKADEIRNQSIADLCVDCVWGSGSGYIRRIQSALGLTADGIVGPKTLAKLNGPDPQKTFGTLWGMRKAYFEVICRNNPKLKVFLKGWMNRLNTYKYED